MTLKNDAKLEKSDFFQKHRTNLANFHQGTQKSQNWNFEGII